MNDLNTSLANTHMSTLHILITVVTVPNLVFCYFALNKKICTMTEANAQ